MSSFGLARSHQVLLSPFYWRIGVLATLERRKRPNAAAPRHRRHDRHDSTFVHSGRSRNKPTIERKERVPPIARERRVIRAGARQDVLDARAGGELQVQRARSDGGAGASEEADADAHRALTGRPWT